MVQLKIVVKGPHQPCLSTTVGGAIAKVPTTMKGTPPLVSTDVSKPKKKKKRVEKKKEDVKGPHQPSLSTAASGAIAKVPTKMKETPPLVPTDVTKPKKKK